MALVLVLRPRAHEEPSMQQQDEQQGQPVYLHERLQGRHHPRR